MHAAGMHHAWTRLFVLFALRWLPWALATPLVIHLERRGDPNRLRSASFWLAHLGAAMAVILTAASWNAGLEVLLDPWLQPGGPGRFGDLWRRKFIDWLLLGLILYAFIVTVSYVLDSRERLASQRTEAARLGEQLSQAQLESLRRQIEPHFLFNTLNALAGLVREHRNDEAIRMLVGLSDFLRQVVAEPSGAQVPLRQEVEFLQRYLEIQQIRFAERLRVSMEIPQALLNAMVPGFLLQPLVENAIKHGVSQLARGGAIRITATQTQNDLDIAVYNDGPGLPQDWEATPAGVGIRNLRTRLQILHGDAFKLRLHNRDGAGVEVLVRVPLQAG